MATTQRILDKHNYSKKTLDTFEILAAYYVDIYYNHLYIEAQKLKTDKKVSSITEGYKHALNAFLQAIDHGKIFKKTLTGINTLFIESGFSSMSLNQCIERMTQEFIPTDYYNTVSKEKKINLLNRVLTQANKSFIEKIVRKYLQHVIDNHFEKDNIRVFQDEFIDLLLLEREEIFHRFISNKTNSSQSQIGIVEKLQGEIKVLLTEKYELKKNITLLKKIIINKDKENGQTKQHVQQLNQKINYLNNTLNEQKNELDKFAKREIAKQAEVRIIPQQEQQRADNLTQNNRDVVPPVLPVETTARVSSVKTPEVPPELFNLDHNPSQTTVESPPDTIKKEQEQEQLQKPQEQLQKSQNQNEPSSSMHIDLFQLDDNFSDDNYFI